LALAQGCPGVIPTAMKLAGAVFRTTAQYWLKKPGTGLVIRLTMLAGFEDRS
jgi:hypothetical protein